jgi:hypothetical protein
MRTDANLTAPLHSYEEENSEVFFKAVHVSKFDVTCSRESENKYVQWLR